MSPRSRKLLAPGNSPEKLVKLSTIELTWSITSPNVNSVIAAFKGLFCKLIGIS